MPQKSYQTKSESQHVQKSETVGRITLHGQIARDIAARLADLSPQALLTLADVVHDLLEPYAISDGEEWVDEKFHRLAGEIAGKEVPPLPDVRQSLAKIPGVLTDDFVAERGIG